MAFLVATTSLLAVYRPNGYARTTTAGTPHARANKHLANHWPKMYQTCFGFKTPQYELLFWTQRHKGLKILFVSNISALQVIAATYHAQKYSSLVDWCPLIVRKIAAAGKWNSRGGCMEYLLIMITMLVI